MSGVLCHKKIAVACIFSVATCVMAKTKGLQVSEIVRLPPPSLLG